MDRMSSMASRTSPMSALVVVGFAVAVVLLFNVRDGVAMSDEKRLIKFLLENYETVGVIGRPVFNTSETIKVYYGLALIQILDLDEKNQVLTTNVWSRYNWNDMLLKWNPDLFGGVDHVRVPVSKIWKPDIVLYNYADTRLREHRDAMAVVSSNGDVLWMPPAIFRSTCSIDILYFPYDIQSCHLKFGSWTYDGFKLDINFYEGIERVDVDDYVDSNEWKLVSYPAKKHVKFYPCCKEPFPDLTFTIQVKRIAAFYSFILVLPCVLLSLLTLVSFWLPPESPAKVLLGMNIFVAFFLLLRILADSTPPASTSVPLIGAYFCLNMILTTLSSFLSVTVINIYMREDKSNKVPSWLKKLVIDGLSRMLCMEQAKQISSTHRHRKSAGSGSGSGNNRNHVSTIRPPPLPLNKWEPPPYQLRESPTINEVPTFVSDAASQKQPHQFPNHVGPYSSAASSATATPSKLVCTYYRRYRQPDVDDDGQTPRQRRGTRRLVLCDGETAPAEAEGLHHESPLKATYSSCGRSKPEVEVDVDVDDMLGLNGLTEAVRRLHSNDDEDDEEYVKRSLSTRRPAPLCQPDASMDDMASCQQNSPQSPSHVKVSTAASAAAAAATIASSSNQRYSQQQQLDEYDCSMTSGARPHRSPTGYSNVDSLSSMPRQNRLHGLESDQRPVIVVSAVVSPPSITAVDSNGGRYQSSDGAKQAGISELPISASYRHQGTTSTTTTTNAVGGRSGVLCADCCRLAAAAWSTSLMKCDPAAGSHNVDGRTAQSSVEVGLAVESEVKEIKRMLRSFMAKLSMRDMRDRNALEWRTVALALDRLFFFIYLVIIILALGAVIPWQEAVSVYRPTNGQGTTASDSPDTT